MSGQPEVSDQLRRESLICAQCGACRDVCPSFLAIGWESSSPRGRMAVLKDLAAGGKGFYAATEEQVRTLCQCTLCGACGQSCAALIGTREVWLEARSALARQGRAVSQFSRLAEALREAKNIAALDNEDRLDWAEDLDEESIPSLVGDLSPDTHDIEALYFVGCVASFFPRATQIAEAFAELMAAAGVRFAALGGQEWCCGFPLAASGYGDEARVFREHNIGHIRASGVKRLVMTCPSCYHTYADASREQLREGGIEVLHASQFLLELVKSGRLELGGREIVATYHDPCDLGRNSGIYGEPRELLRSIRGLTLVEPSFSRQHAACCGGGGSLQSFDQELVDRIAATRADQIAESGAEVLVSACQQCEQVLEAAIRQRGHSFRVVDICELVLESLA